MNGFLIDTNVLSLLAPGRPQTDRAVVEWIVRQANDGHIWIAAMTIAETEQGIRKLLRRGAHERAAALTRWIETFVSVHGEQILPMGTAVARHVGLMSELTTAEGRYPGLADIIIAATAAAYDLVLVTGNTRHFDGLGLQVLSPAEVIAG